MTLKRVFVLLGAYLVSYLILFLLLLDILSQGLLLQPYCTDVVPGGPEMPVAIELHRLPWFSLMA